MARCVIRWPRTFPILSNEEQMLKLEKDVELYFMKKEKNHFYYEHILTERERERDLNSVG